MHDFNPESVTWVLDDEDLGFLFSAIEEAEEVVVDLENTGLDEHAVRGGATNEGFPARVALASLTLPTEGQTEDDDPLTAVLPLSHPDSPWSGQWRDVFRVVALHIVRHEKPVINQNMKYDARWFFAHAGVDLSPLIAWDPQISGHLKDENVSSKLKVSVPREFGVPRWDDFDLSKPGAAERVPLLDLGMYAARDTYWSWRQTRLHRAQMLLAPETRHHEPDGPDEVELARLGRLATWVVMPTLSTLTSVEQRGMLLDREWTIEKLAEHRKGLALVTHDLVHLYPGLDTRDSSFAPTSHWFRDWTEKAVEAGDLRVAALTPGGKPQWSKGVLVRQARSGSMVAAKLLEQRSHAKRAEYLESWLRFQSPATKAIHAHYNVGSVVTGRLSSSEPNMQQVTATLKPAYIPRPGFVFADFDYSQIEMRVAAHVSGCKPMIEAFRRGEDTHKMLASVITGKPLESVEPAERQGGKSANFGLLYGMGAYGFREYAETVYGVSFTLEEAFDVRAAFFATWEGIGEWHTRSIARARATGQISSPIGRVRRLPHIWDANDKLAAYAERSAINSPVQGFASDIMQIAAALIAGRIPGSRPVEGVHLVGTVHDSLLAEVPEDDWVGKVAECREILEHGVNDVLKRLDCVLTVPLVADVKVGTRWGLDDVSAAFDEAMVG